MSTAARTAGPLLVAAALALVLGGCASDESGSQSPSPSASPSVSAFGASATLSEEVLLPDEDMPVWNGAITWTASPPDAEFKPSPLCELPTAEKLGAQDVVQRGYTSDQGDMRGSNQVAVFADAVAAESAFKILDDEFVGCRGEPQSDDPRTDSSITRTDTMAPFTGARPCQAVPDRECTDDEALFEFAGIAVSGDKVTLVTFDLIGQDANWTEDPLVPSLKASLDRL